MKITYLAAGHSIHTVRWVNALADRGHDVALLTLQPTVTLFPVSSRVKVRVLPIGGPVGYFLNAPVVRRILRSTKPDIVHAHYASGYGTLSRLAGFSPSILSVWGSDVYDFPYQSKRKESLIRRNLRAADFVWTTSQALRKQTERFSGTERPIYITPFGIDSGRFKPGLDRPADGTFVVGIVKDLEPAYGIDKLLRAFALLKQSPPPGMRPRLVIAGGGSVRAALEDLAGKLGISEETEFTGAIPHQHVPQLLNSFSVFVALSVSESFGVSVLEASACGVPVIVSDAGGLPEVVVNGKTGFIVPGGDPELAFQTLRRVADDRQLAMSLGEEGRRFVHEQYEWTDSVSRVERAYERIVQTGGNNADS